MTVKLIIKDEVNISFNGLPVEARRRLVANFKYEVPYARYSPHFKLGRWDGKVSLFGLGGDGYMYHLEEILSILTSMGIEIDQVEDNRTYIDLTFDEITEDYWSKFNKVWPVGHIMEGKPIVLRDYQVSAINLFVKHPQSLQEISTSAGKTIITATLSHMCEKYGRTITIVPSKSLVEQTLEDYINVGLDVGVYYGNRKDLDKTHTICTWQSLAILDKKSEDIRAIEALSNLLSNVNTVIVDEVHSVKGELLRKFLTKNIAHAPIRWGLTGTVPKEKFESEGIFTSLGPLTGGVTAHELQESGVLSNCSVNILQLYDLAEFKTFPEETKYLTTSIPRVKYISDLINEISESGNTLVLVSRIETGKMLAENIPGSVFLSGKITTKNRKEEFDEVKIVDNKVIIATAGIAAVGINIVRLFNLVLIEPGKSFVRVIQSIGRGLRKGGDKDHVNIYDITSTCKFSKRHLTTRKRFYKDAQYEFTVKKVDWNV